MSASVEFPDPNDTLEGGILAVGGKWNAPTLLAAYRKGIFPWPQQGLPILWFSPEQRGIILFDEFRVPKSVQKFKKQNPQLKITLNQSFAIVMEECRKQKRKGQNGTWILPEMIPAYVDLFKNGNALSIEVWEDSDLVGGIYGVLVDGVFSGESMFHKKENCSKLALWSLVEYLKQQGHHWIDIQMVTPVTKLFGGKYISREEFQKMLKLSQRKKSNQ